MLATVVWAVAGAACQNVGAQAMSGVRIPFRVSDPRSPRETRTALPGGFTRVHRQISAKPTDSLPQAAAPEFSLTAGAYSSAQTVTMTDATTGGTIYYTTDGSIPSTSSPAYSGPITISKSLTVAAFASAPGYSTSDWNFATYFIGTAPDSFMYNIAGTDFWGFEGDGGPATQALLNIPQGTAVDKSGNVYISDSRNQIIRKIDASTGIISTIAGTGVAGLSGDGGPAIDAQLNWPASLAVDSAGNLYVSEADNNDVRKIDLDTGIITTYVKSLISPYGITFDSNDNLYVVANSRVFEVDAKTQTVTAVAGNGEWGTAGDGGPALLASMSLPQDVAVDKSGNLYIADTFNGAVRFVERSTGLMTTVAGKLGSIFGYSGDGGPATAAEFSWPNAVAVDPGGDLWISDEYNWRIRKVTLATGIVSTAVGNGQACFSTGEDGSPATFAAVCQVYGLTFDKAGNLYYADLGPSRIKKVTAPAPPPTDFTAAPQFGLASGTYVDPQHVPITEATPGATVYLSFGAAASTPITEAQSYHGDLEVDGDMAISAIAVAPGHLPSAVSSASYKITAPPTSIISTVAGSGSFGFSGAGGPATSAQIGQFQLSPAIDASGNIFIADVANSVVWKVDSGTGNIAIIAGTGHTGYTGDGGPATSATLNQPYSVAVDAVGNVYIADTGNNVIREVLAADGTIKTFAGDHSRIYNGSLGDGGPANAAQLSSPEGIAVDGNSNVYIADTRDCSVREVFAATGIIQTVVGTGPQCGQSPDGTPATAGLVGPIRVVTVQAGNIYFAEQQGGRIRKVDAASHVLSTVAGNGNYGTSGDGTLATQAEVEADAFAFDSQGNIYLAGLDELRKVDVNTGIIDRIAGMGYGGLRGDGIPAMVANVCVYNGTGIALDSSGTLYFGDECAYSIRKVTFLGPAAKPAISLAAGSYDGPQSVSITDSATSAAIYYTLDGSTPDTGSTLYSGPITVGISETLNAVAVVPGFTTSSVASAAYVITPIAAPIAWATPAAITYGTALDATELNATSSASGSFAYSPSAGTILGAGSQTLTATFTPDADSGYTSATASVTLTVNKATPVNTLAASSNTAFASNPVTFTAMLSAPVGSPTGTVTFMDGTSQLGTGTISAGAASYTTLSLSAGAHAITAVYPGDNSFNAVTSVPITETIEDFTFAPPNGGSTSARVKPGGTATYTLAVTPPSGGKTASAVSFSVTGLPAGATGTFNPSSVPANSAATNVTLSVSVSKQSAAARTADTRLPLALGLLVLPFLGLRRKMRFAGRTLLLVVVALAGAAATMAFTGCGGSGTKPQTYNLIVTATAGALTHTTQLTLTVE